MRTVGAVMAVCSEAARGECRASSTIVADAIMVVPTALEAACATRVDDGGKEHEEGNLRHEALVE